MSKLIGFSFLFHRILLMILAAGFFALAMGSSDSINLLNLSQIKLYGFIALFVLTYLFLRTIRIKKKKDQYNKILHWFAFTLLLLCCFGLVQILADVWQNQNDAIYILTSVLLIGIFNGLFLCCVFISRRRV